MEKVTMEAAVRDGKATARKLKKDGKIPAVIYGKETKSMPIEIKIKDIEKTVKTLSQGTILITLKLTDKNKNEEKIVSIKEISRNPVTDEITHADLYQVSVNEKSKFQVPVFGNGVPEGVKEGGVLEHMARSVTVRCLPEKLPARFDLDLTPLKIFQTITVKDLKAPEGVEILDDPNMIIFAVKTMKKIEEPVPGAAAAPAGAEAAKEPEVIKGAPKPEESAAAAPAKDSKKK